MKGADIGRMRLESAHVEHEGAVLVLLDKTGGPVAKEGRHLKLFGKGRPLVGGEYGSPGLGVAKKALPSFAVGGWSETVGDEVLVIVAEAVTVLPLGILGPVPVLSADPSVEPVLRNYVVAQVPLAKVPAQVV